MKYLFPRFEAVSWRILIGVPLGGALIAGIYGIAHDQITYTLSPEYFTRFKFEQFRAADFGYGDRVFVGVIGFLATWWVGLIAGWILVRVSQFGRGAGLTAVAIARRFWCVIAVALVSGLAGYLFGIYRVSGSGLNRWRFLEQSYGVTDIPAFAKVSYVHGFGYVGAVVGVAIAAILIRRAKVADGGRPG